jgi:hypothetical protein
MQSDHQEDQVQRMIQRRLRGGALPTEAPVQVLNGASSGRFCAACCRYLAEGEDEIQAVDGNGASTYFHPLCFGVAARLRESIAGNDGHASAFQLLRLLIGANKPEKRKAA